MPKRQRRQPAAPTVADAKRETDRLVHNVFGVDAAGICRDAGEALQKLRPRSLSAGHQPLAVSQYLPQVVLAVALITIVFDISVGQPIASSIPNLCPFVTTHHIHPAVVAGRPCSAGHVFMRAGPVRVRDLGAA